MNKKEKIIAGLAIGATILTMAQCGYYTTKSYTPSENVKIPKKVEQTVPPAVIDDVVYHQNGDIDFKMSFPDEGSVPPAVIDDVVYHQNGDIDFKMSFPDEEDYSQTKTR